MLGLVLVARTASIRPGVVVPPALDLALLVLLDFFGDPWEGLGGRVESRPVAQGGTQSRVAADREGTLFCRSDGAGEAIWPAPDANQRPLLCIVRECLSFLEISDNYC